MERSSMEATFLSYRRDNKDPFHRMAAPLKVLWTLIVAGLALLIEDLPPLIAISLFVIFDVVAAGMLRSWLRFMKYTGPMLTLIVFINSMLSGVGSRVFFTFPWSIPIFGRPILTVESLSLGLIMALRLLITLTVFLIFTLTTSPEDILLTLSFMRIPPKTMVASYLSLRLVPTLMDDLYGISEVRRSKGLSNEGGRSILGKIKEGASIIVPLLSNSLERAIQIAEAMEARAFGASKRRTTYKAIKWELREKAYATSFIAGGLFTILGSHIAYLSHLWISGIAALAVFAPPILSRFSPGDRR